MKLFTEFNVDEGVQAGAQTIGLQSYDDFIEFTGGELVSRAEKSPVRKIMLESNGISSNYYLKQTAIFRYRTANQQTSTKKHISSMLRMLRRGRWPHCRSFLEYLSVVYYQRLNIPVMEPIAWGEKRFLGWPLNGFVLVKESVGESLSVAFSNATENSRRKLAYSYGSLLGCMHYNGVFDGARCRDVICKTDDSRDFRKSLVAIDRERGKYCDSIFKKSREETIRLIVKSLRGSLFPSAGMIVGAPTKIQLLAFFSGYFRQNAQASGDKREILTAIRRQALAEFRGEKDYNNMSEVIKGLV